VPRAYKTLNPGLNKKEGQYPNKHAENEKVTSIRYGTYLKLILFQYLIPGFFFFFRSKKMNFNQLWRKPNRL